MTDRFSTLPDEVLSYILSFLPTEDAFTTSILSNRWRPLWLLVPNLDLDEQRFINKTAKPISLFTTMVSKAIFSRSCVYQPIKRIRLICDGKSNFEPLDFDVEKWLTVATEHPIQHLDLRLSFIPHFPSCIFSCKTLVVLKLKVVFVRAFSTVHLPSLKTLHFNEVRFVDRCYLAELLNGCPILEDFEAVNLSLYGWSLEREFKSLSKLVRAKLSNIDVCNIPLQIFGSVANLRLEKVYPNNVPLFFNVSRVVLIFGRIVDWRMVYDMVKNCPKLQNFLLHKPRLLKSVNALEHYSNFVPECLSSQFRKCIITNYLGEKNEVRFAKYIVQNSTSLQAMTIYTPSSLNPQGKLEMQEELLLCPKRSATCKICFK